jgi:hypothetical protein
MADADDEWDEEALHRIREDVEAELAAVDDFPMIPFQPPLGGGGIVGVFVPPAVPVNQQALAIQIARADAHEAAFPFAAIGRSFLCNIQKAWLKYWGNALAYRPELSWQERHYPLRYTIPSFGWQELMRLDDRDETCQMCGHEHLHVVVIMRNIRAPVGLRVLRVGKDCAVFMSLLSVHVRQIAFDNSDPLP